MTGEQPLQGLDSQSDDERGATINVWCEPTGYWSGSVVVRSPGIDNWKAYATSFHDIGEAVEWARQQVDLAVSHG